MLKPFYSLGLKYPKLILLAIAMLTLYFALQLPQLRWETDARVYLPNGHPAILYDEKVDAIFGVKDAMVIAIVNEEEGVFNPDTLAHIASITEKLAALPGVKANRTLDVVSLSTATLFVGDEESIGSMALMKTPATDETSIEELKKIVYGNADLFVGNIVSKDGKAAMIRARLKEGADNRYMTYWQVKAILDAEYGVATEWGEWSGEGDWGGGEWEDSSAWEGGSQSSQSSFDKVYISGRPVIEVTSGLDAMTDMKIMVPMLVVAIGLALFIIFRNARGVVLPIAVVTISIIWTMGAMVLMGIPLYTISTMLPVILVAVGIGDAVHLMSRYYDHVLQDPHGDAHGIVQKMMHELGPPLLVTSLTTSIGFLSFYFAEMPPFKIFGLFTVLGIMFSWLISVLIIPAALSLLKPKVGNYLARQRSLRIRSEQSVLTLKLVQASRLFVRYRTAIAAIIVVISILSVMGASRLFVDSSWMSDFREDSDIVVSNNVLNNKFDGTLFLNVVFESEENDAIKSPELLKKIEEMQLYLEQFPYVGDSLSIVDYLKSVNKNLNSGQEAYNVLPDSRAIIAEYLYLLSISGQPEQLSEVIDYDYRRTLVSFSIKTDHTQDLKVIIDAAESYIDKEFKEFPVEVNLAGSANNSFVWAKLLIESQAIAIIFSKIGIFLIASLLFRSMIIGLFVVLPVTLTTLIMAGVAGVLRIPIDVSTTLAAGVAIGVGVDYAVHYIFKYKATLNEFSDSMLATTETFRRVGRTIVLNALIVITGFAVLLFSQFPPHIKLGYFVIIYMMLSCLVALIILPVLFSFYKPINKTEGVGAAA